MVGRVASRLAWREVRHARGRSTLIVALISLPVLVLTLIATLTASAKPTASEMITQQLGSAQAYVSDKAQGCVQEPTALDRCLWRLDGPSHVATHADFKAVSAHGTHVIDVLLFRDVMSIVHDRRLVRHDVNVVAGDVTHSALAGVWDVMVGRAPTSAHEVAINRSAARTWQRSVGQTVIYDAQPRVITGIISDHSVDPTLFCTYPVGQEITGYRQDHIAGVERRTYLLGAPVGWPQVQAWNELGLVTLSQQVLRDPPQVSAKPEFSSWLSDVGQGFVVLLLGVLLAAAVVFVAGAAFGIGIKNQRRQLGLLAATGADDRIIVATVRWLSMFLGGIGAAVGMIVGLVLACVVWLLGKRQEWLAWPSIHVPWLQLPIIAALGMGSAMAAAYVPARKVSRQDTYAAVREAEAPTQPATFPIFGLVLVGLGVGLCIIRLVLVSASSGREAFVMDMFTQALVVIAALLLLPGLIMCVPMLLQVVGRIGGRGGVAFRLSARDLSRNRHRSVPAVASVMSITALFAGLAMLSASESGSGLPKEERVQPNHVVVYASTRVGGAATRPQPSTSESNKGDAAQSKETASVEPDFAQALSLVQESHPDAQGHKINVVDTHFRMPRDCDQTGDTRGCSYTGTSYGETVLGGPDEFRLLWGRQMSDEEHAAWAQGVALTAKNTMISDGKIVLEDHGKKRAANSVDGGITVPARYAQPSSVAASALLINPATAQGLQLSAPHTRLIIDVGPVDAATRQLLQDTIQTYVAGVDVAAKQDHSDPALIVRVIVNVIVAVIALAVAGVTTALALSDSRRDQATMAAVGAAPGVRKRIAAASMAQVTGTGGLLGVIAGMVPMLAMQLGSRGAGGAFAIPWPELLMLLVLLPLLGAALAWLITPAKLDFARRLDT